MMRTSLLICATCLLVTGCSAQFRLPSLSSALSSLTGFGSSAGANSAAGQNGAQAGQASSPYSGLVRDYGRNLMMAMSSIYPTLFKPPQQQQQAQPQQSQQAQSPFEQFSASQSIPSQSLFSGQSGPSFSFGGSTFSISPSFPFGSLAGAGSQQQQQPQQQQQQPQNAAAGPGQAGAHSPFSASFGSSINSPPSFGPLSSSPFLSQSMPSFAPASSYNAAFEAANGGNQGLGGLSSAAGASSMGSPLFASMGQGPSSMQAGASMMSQGGQGSQLGAFSQLPSFGQHDSASQMLAQPSHHQPQSVGQGAHQSGAGFGMGAGAGQQQSQPALSQQYSNSQQFRPDMMSVAASAPVPSSSSYSNYGNVPAQQGQAPSAASYQQPSYR